LKKIVACVALFVIAAAAVGVPPKRPAAHPAAVSRDWTQVVATTPSDGMLIGNPAAKVKLVEMLSLTCSHCALFEREAVPKLLAKYVRTGKVSYEVRFALRDPFDLVAAVLARCDGPKRFFQLAPILYAAQDQWLSQAEAWQATAPDLSTMSEADAGRTLMKGAGLDKIVTANGMSAARAGQCFDDVAAQQRLSAKAQVIWQTPGFKGTPGFLINGKLNTEIHDWAGIDAALTAALR
jgi:protein-disulfide isomerase